MAKTEKVFNKKLYAVITFFLILAILVTIVTTTFKSKYTAFHPEEVARTYVDTIVQTGDGYNAYKMALMSKNQKYGDFIRENYMYPIIYRDTAYKIGDDTDGLKGYNDESYKGEISKLDDGKKQGEVINTMYDYYVELIANGWDNYDIIFKKYFDKLVEVRKEIFKDDYMTDEIMFTALEANVRTYGESLVGTEDVFDTNTGKQTSEKTIGAYEAKYGENYKFTSTVTNVEDIQVNFTENYGIKADEVSEAKKVTVDVTTEDGTIVSRAVVIVVKIDSFWYVDNTQTVTTDLYKFYK